MFKIPEWGTDIPNSNVNLKRPKMKKRKNDLTKSKESQKLHNLKKPNFKAKKSKTNKLTSENNNCVSKFSKNNKKKELLKENCQSKSVKLILYNKNNKQDSNDKSQETNSKKQNILFSSYNKQSSLKNKNKQTSLSRKSHIDPKSNTHMQKNKSKKMINTKIGDLEDNNHENSLINKSKDIDIDANKTNVGERKENIELQNYDADNLDEIIINAKKKKLVATFQNEDNEEVLFNDNDNNKKNSLIIEKIEKQTKPKKFKSSETKLLLKQGNEQTQLHELKKNKEKTNENQHTNNKTINDTRKSIKEILKQKQKFKNLLENKHRTQLTVNSGIKLRERMLERLNAAKFRYLNEKLYTSSGTEAQKLFVSDPVAFQTYHQGYQQQVKKWPVNPLDIVVKRIQNMPKTHLIADMGCGEAALSKRVPHTVRSFDLVSAGAGVEVCDMAHTPLLTSSIDVAVYCLALMGTDLTQYLLEANRILKIGGHLLVAEVESRFDNVEMFTKDVQRLGFTLKKLDKTHEVFFFMDFVKAREAPSKKSKLPTLSLKPCLYKKR